MQGKLTCAQLFQKNKFIPVIILDDINKAVPIAHALLDGGISIIEVTLRTKNALAIIQKLSQEVPQMITGAGSVLNDDHYHMAVSHGAKFIVSPGLTLELAKVSQDYDVPFLPGAVTPTEIMQAILMGFNYLKFFPAEGYSGYMVLKSLVSLFAEVKFCPTGGITIDNAKKYLGLPNVAGVGCSFFVNEQDIVNSNYVNITQLVKKAYTQIG